MKESVIPESQVNNHHIYIKIMLNIKEKTKVASKPQLTSGMEKKRPYSLWNADTISK